jgi:predicted nucleic acid-binding protein
VALAARGTTYEPLLAAPVVSEGFQLVPMTLEALVVAARVRAMQPMSRSKAKRTNGRKDPERRVSWGRDIELAAIGATSGLPVATQDHRDFTIIAALLRRVAPRLTLELRNSVVAD